MSLYRLKHLNRDGLEEKKIYVHCSNSCSDLHSVSMFEGCTWYLASAEVPARRARNEMERDGDFEVGINTGDMEEQNKFKNFLVTSELGDSFRT